MYISDIYFFDILSLIWDVSFLLWKINFYKNVINKSIIYYKINFSDNWVFVLMLVELKFILIVDCWYFEIYLFYLFLFVVYVGFKVWKYELVKLLSFV